MGFWIFILRSALISALEYEVEELTKRVDEFEW